MAKLQIIAKMSRNCPTFFGSCTANQDTFLHKIGKNLQLFPHKIGNGRDEGVDG